MAGLEFSRAPLGVSLQDSGRTGYLRFGVARGGPMDWARHRLANRMLGNPAGATAIEFGPAGLALELDSGELQLSFCAPGFRLMIGDTSFTGPRRFVLAAGQALQIKPKPGAMWGYLGLCAEIDVPALLGSHADNSASGLRAAELTTGSFLSLRPKAMIRPRFQAYIDPFLADHNLPLEILPSSQYDYFSAEELARLAAHAVTIASRFDRMAYRLQGVQLSSKKGHDILSDGVTMGAIQVPGDGRPFILMADHQPTGGYPKIGCVCKADLPRLAQMAPGQPFMLRWVDIDRAMQRWQWLQQQIDAPTALKGVD